MSFTYLTLDPDWESGRDPASFAELEEAAVEVIGHLKEHGFGEHKLIIIGGLAVWKLLPYYRTTDDIDFLITVNGAPNALKALKEKLERIYNSPFVDNAGVLSYNSISGKLIRIDLMPDSQLPYLPENAQKVSEIQSVSLPYVSIEDLIVFKINSCGLRVASDKKVQDAADAYSAVASAGLSLRLSNKQKHTARGGLPAVAAALGYPKSWWEGKLAL
ncbi:hypothetical protein DRE_04761 [Drechslerella stenobrocha 248]|uniref:Uncharacterized protein n=1 Tax=Drechslerella stenobrocha 248 TaxID=1043628 RepID=W7I194_9PEZI|nr:hypothetical protein DRE_04761 [Drechslerella stenobrocha 248]